MKNKKMVLWIALIVIAIIPVYAQQYDSEKDFQIDWDKDVKDGVIITKYIGTRREVSIPPKIQNNTVTGIGISAFYNNKNITSVIIPNSVVSLGGFGNTSLTSITIPNSVKAIDYGAFKECKNLKSITIPDSVIIIGNGAFQGCTGLTSVTIPNSVKEIWDEAFYSCTSLTSVTIGNSVTSIGNSAFSECSKLTNVTIGNSVTNIGGRAFEKCTSLTSVTIPDSVTSIGNFAFWYCTKLTSITIPNSVTNIAWGAFFYCESLTSVTFQSTIAKGTIKKDINIFDGDLGDKYLASDGGPGVYTRFAGGNVWKKTQSISQPAAPSQGTTQQPNAAVSAAGTPGLEYYILNSNNKELGVSAGTARGTVVIPATYDNLPVTVIMGEGFMFIDGITDITIPNSVRSIGDRAFRDCTKLTSVIIPKSVFRIGDGAFRDCSNLTSVTFEGTIRFDLLGSMVFPGDLRAKYLKGGPGTYTRPDGKSTKWTKQ